MTESAGQDQQPQVTTAIAAAISVVAAAGLLHPTEQAQLIAELLIEHEPIVLVSAIAQLAHAYMGLTAHAAGIPTDDLVTVLGHLHARQS